MKKTGLKTQKNILAMLLTFAMILGIITTTPLTAFAESNVTDFVYDGYTVNYEITNSWNNGQNNNVTVTITNTGAETIENWMLAYDFMGEVNMQSGGTIFEEDGITYVKNTGTNLAGYGDSININAGMSVNFSYSLKNPTGTPDTFYLCQERIALENGIDYTVTLNPQWDYGSSFQGEILLQNLTDKPIECWDLTFASSNFTIQNSWEKTLIDLGGGRYTIKPIDGNIVRIAPNSTLTLGFQANKDPNLGFADLEIDFEGLTGVVFGGVPNGGDEDDDFELPEGFDVLVAFGTFEEETNSIILEWSYKDIDGVFNIYEISGVKTLIASVANERTYSFEVDNSVAEYIFIVEKYISVNEILVSNEVVIRANEDGYYEFIYIDSDEDGLPDIYEYIIGTDPQNPDTDGDGLPDGYEYFTLGTDPLKVDTDDNGISDADEDFDEDGLINLEEYLMDNNPWNPDTDGDGLSDGDEVHLYDTDPLNPDTDEDGLLDGEEGYNGLFYTKYNIYFDPKNPKTDGITIDGERVVQQTEAKEVITHDGAITNISVEMDTNGSLVRHLNIESKFGKDILSSDVVGLIGDPFDFTVFTEFSEAKLTFTVDKTKLGETDFEDLLFLWFDEENQNFVELDTIIDENNSTVSTITSHFSQYMVVDAKTWFAVWSNNQYIDMAFNDLPYQPNSRGIANSLPSSKTEALALSKSFGDSNYLLIETANLTWKQAQVYCESYGGHLATITTSAENTFVWNLINSGSKTWYWIGGIWDAYQSPKWITGEEFKSSVGNFTDTWGSSLSGNLGGYRNGSGYTSGIWYKGRTEESPIGNYVPLSFVCEWDKEIVLLDSDEDGLPDIYETRGMPLSNGKPIKTNPNEADTERDGLKDGVEINPKIQSQTVNTNLTKYYFKIVSEPTLKDSDFDGYNDDVDLAPLTEFKAPVLFVSNDLKKDFNISGGTATWDSTISKGAAYRLLNYDDYKPYVNYFYCNSTSIFDIDTYIKDYIETVYDKSKVYPTKNSQKPLISIIDSGISIEKSDISSIYDGGFSFSQRSWRKADIEKVISFNASKPIKISSGIYNKNVDYYSFSKDDIDNAVSNASTFINKILKPTTKISNDEYYMISNNKINLSMTDLFDKSATVENNSLRELSAQAATFAYDDVLFPKNTEPVKIQKMLSDLSFKDIVSANYHDNDEDNISYTFANRKLSNGTTVVAVILRGTDEVEWKGNFKVWKNANTPTTYAYSFNRAAVTLYGNLCSYLLDNVDKNSNVKFWVTGHSRGAAVANILSAMLTNSNTAHECDNDIYGAYSETIWLFNQYYPTNSDNVYAYTFATPNVKYVGTNNLGSLTAGYENIRNYVHDNDFVTEVPLKKWGYDKFGITTSFHTSYISVGYPDYSYIRAGEIKYSVKQGACTDGLNAFYNAASNVDNYYNKKYNNPLSKNTFFELAYTVIAPGAMGIGKKTDGVGTFIAGLGGNELGKVLAFFKDNKDTTIYYAHIPQTYYYNAVEKQYYW